jgi:hypothetical protein
MTRSRAKALFQSDSELYKDFLFAKAQALAEHDEHGSRQDCVPKMFQSKVGFHFYLLDKTGFWKTYDVFHDPKLCGKNLRDEQERRRNLSAAAAPGPAAGPGHASVCHVSHTVNLVAADLFTHIISFLFHWASQAPGGPDLGLIPSTPGQSLSHAASCFPVTPSAGVGLDQQLQQSMTKYFDHRTKIESEDAKHRRAMEKKAAEQRDKDQAQRDKDQALREKDQRHIGGLIEGRNLDAKINLGLTLLLKGKGEADEENENPGDGAAEEAPPSPVDPVSLFDDGGGKIAGKTTTKPPPPPREIESSTTGGPVDKIVQPTAAKKATSKSASATPSQPSSKPAKSSEPQIVSFSHPKPTVCDDGGPLKVDDQVIMNKDPSATIYFVVEISGRSHKLSKTRRGQPIFNKYRQSLSKVKVE